MDRFWPPVAEWFRATYGTPTPPQQEGWPVIARGEHALILSPTGSGKTLTAFLWSLDSLFRELPSLPPKEQASGIRVVYVSPLKALNNDVERNLQLPLEGIRQQARAAGIDVPDIRVAVRTGDTPNRDRQAMLRRPPHILITTPESLYLMVTAERARDLFSTTHTVIVDEIHTLVGTKRGAHLTITLERLERLAKRAVQRIGLSATIQPLDNAAHFLGGLIHNSTSQEHAQEPFAYRPVTVVDAGTRKPMDVRVVTPTDDFRNLPGNSIWSLIIPEVTRLIEQHHTTLVFCNNRRLAERTADRLNEQRLLDAQASSSPVHRSDLGMFAAGVDAATLEAAGLEPIRAHHGSMSKTARLEMETALKAGTLPALVATASLELGIDIGDVDLVVHLQSPKSVGAALQRVGRSGHLVGQIPKGRIYPSFPEDVIEAAAVARGMLVGEVDATSTPENPLDVLAQQILAMVSAEDWRYGALFDCVRRAFPYRSLGEPAFRSVVQMLAGRYSDEVSRTLKPRLSWDQVHDRLTALPGTRLLAVQSGGTIPDRGTYSLVLADRKTRIGELDEEFVYETRVGDNFLLGTQVWKVSEITDERVIAEPAPGEVPRMPFWRGDFPWRPRDLGTRLGSFRRHVADLLSTLSPREIEHVLDLDDEQITALTGSVPYHSAPVTPHALVPPAALRLLSFLHHDCALDRNSIVHVITHITKQLDSVGHVATDQTIVIELYEDAVGDPRIVVHSPYGGRVNGPWAIALAGAIRERTGVEAQITPGDDGLLIRFVDADAIADRETLLRLIRDFTSHEAREHLIRELPTSPVFGAQFRMNAARALLLPRDRGGKRTPLWLSRLKAKDLLQAVQHVSDFPILLETYRDCLRDVMDLDGLVHVLDGIRRGDIQVVVHESERPSPLATGLDYRFSMRYMYEYDAPRGERSLAALSVDRTLLAELLQDGTLAGLLEPEAVESVTAFVGRTSQATHARSAEELAQLLYELGDLTEEEIAVRCAGSGLGSSSHSDSLSAAWIAQLSSAGRIVQRAIADQSRWISAERIPEYDDLHNNPAPVLHRYVMHAGAVSAAALAERYGVPLVRVEECLRSLGEQVIGGRLRSQGPEQWLDRRVLEQMHRRTLTLLRKEVRPVSPSVYQEFLLQWQGVRCRPKAPRFGETSAPLEQRTALDAVLRQLRGIPIPGAALERDVLPARLDAFDPSELARRCQAGELCWTAEGSRDPRRARVRLFARGEGSLFLPPRVDEDVLGRLSVDAAAVRQFLFEEGAALLVDIVDGTARAKTVVQQALVELVLAGIVTNDSLDALRALLGHHPPVETRRSQRSSLEAQLAGRTTEQPRRMTPQRWREAKRRARQTVTERLASLRTPASASFSTGRWFLVHRPSLLGKPLTNEDRILRLTRLLLSRWGIVTRACLDRESIPDFTWDSLYPVLTRLEHRGEIRRGYFVEGFPGIQFATPEAVERLRSVATGDVDNHDRHPIVVSAVDPALALGFDGRSGSVPISRVPSTAVALHGGEIVAAMEDSGSTVEAQVDHLAVVPCLAALAEWWSARSDLPAGHLKVTRWHGQSALEEPGLSLLRSAGYVREGSALLWPGASAQRPMLPKSARDG